MGVNFRGFARLTVYAVQCLEGNGSEADPNRLVTTYYDEAAHELWRDDPAEHLVKTKLPEVDSL